MSFLTNLAKGFVRSAVNQVGRDGGKVISNKIYKGEHGTPVYDSSSFNNISDSNIDYSIQPPVKDGDLLTAFKGIFIQILPLGTVAVLVQAIIYLTRKRTAIYLSQPIVVRDRRYKIGSRVDGYAIVKSSFKRPLSDQEISKSRKRGTYYLISIPLFFALAAILLPNDLLSTNKNKSSQDIGLTETKQLAVVTSNKGLHLRQNPNTNAALITTIPKGDTVVMIASDGPEEIISGKKGNWSHVSFEGKEGWVWGGFVKDIN